MTEPLRSWLERSPHINRDLLSGEAELLEELRMATWDQKLALGILMLRRIADAIDRQTDVIRR